MEGGGGGKGEKVKIFAYKTDEWGKNEGECKMQSGITLLRMGEKNFKHNNKIWHRFCQQQNNFQNKNLRRIEQKNERKKNQKLFSTSCEKKK